MTTVADEWDELVERAGMRPVWSGVVEIRDVPSRTWCWWQAWESFRFDAGFTARVYPREVVGVVGAAVAMVEELTAGLVSDLVVPSLVGVGRWTVERRPVEVVEMEPRWSSKREFSSVRAKVSVRTERGADLEGVLTSMSRFARELGWDGKPLTA